MSDQPQTPQEPEAAESSSALPDPYDVRRLDRHLTTLTATVDQLAAEQSRTLQALAALAFALGMLAGIVGLQHLQIKQLGRALAS